MTLNKRQRDQAVSLLKKARYSYAVLGNEGLCFHIYHVGGKTNCNDTASYLTRLIQQRLRGYIYYPQWLRRYHPELLDSVSGIYLDKGIRSGRLAWFDDLIREFSE